MNHRLASNSTVFQHISPVKSKFATRHNYDDFPQEFILHVNNLTATSFYIPSGRHYVEYNELSYSYNFSQKNLSYDIQAMIRYCNCVASYCCPFMLDPLQLCTKSQDNTGTHSFWFPFMTYSIYIQWSQLQKRNTWKFIAITACETINKNQPKYSVTTWLYKNCIKTSKRLETFRRDQSPINIVAKLLCVQSLSITGSLSDSIFKLTP